MKNLLEWMIGITGIFVALMIYTVSYVFFWTHQAKVVGLEALINGTILSPLFWVLFFLVFAGTTWLFRYSVTRTRPVSG